LKNLSEMNTEELIDELISVSNSISNTSESNYLMDVRQALENKIKGRVTIQFTVSTDGSLSEFSVFKGLGYGCDEEVIRMVKEGPKWSPTTEDNVAVESEVRVRVKFVLPN